jgi:hypothetical protein
VSSVLFVITFGLAFISYALKEKFHPIRTIRSFYDEHLVKLPGWHALKFWLVLIGLGTLSALITPFYGNFLQALNRLLVIGSSCDAVAALCHQALGIRAPLGGLVLDISQS